MHVSTKYNSAANDVVNHLSHLMNTLLLSGRLQYVIPRALFLDDNDISYKELLFHISTLYINFYLLQDARSLMTSEPKTRTPNIKTHTSLLFDMPFTFSRMIVRNKRPTAAELYKRTHSNQPNPVQSATPSPAP